MLPAAPQIDSSNLDLPCVKVSWFIAALNSFNSFERFSLSFGFPPCGAKPGYLFL